MNSASSTAKTPAPAGPKPAGLSPTPEQRRLAAMHFERATNLVATGDYKHGIGLLAECCRQDPANLLYRQALRRAEKARFGNRQPRGWLAWLFTWPLRARLQAARLGGRYLEVLHLGERILVHNPWDVPTQVEMASAAEILGLSELAVWSLEQGRHKEPNDPDLNRRLARLYEKRGHFTQAMALWELVRKAAPDDEEAGQKLVAGAEAPANGSVGQVESLREQLKEDPTRAGVYLELARIYRQAGQFEPAEAALLEGLAATGNAFELTVALVELHLEPFRRDLAITERKLSEAAGDEELERIRQELRREINTRELELYRLLADRFPTQLVHRYEVGVRLLRAGQLDEAIEELRPVRADDRLRGAALLALGHGYRGRNNLRQAARHFEEAVANLPVGQADLRKEGLYELACCLAGLGEWGRAVERGMELLGLDAGYRDVQTLVADWQARARQAQAS